MFQIARKAEGRGGAFVKLVQLDTDDFVVIVRSASDGRLRHVYFGPDFMKAEEVFEKEAVGTNRNQEAGQSI